MIEDFIGVFPNAISSEFCNKLIDRFEEIQQDSSYLVEQRDRHIEQDNTITHLDKWRDTKYFPAFADIVAEFNYEFWEKIYPQYSEKYGILKAVNGHQFYRDLKIQKTRPGEGYHMWHCEHDSREHGSRLLLVIVYLNDVEEGGETEFLYQGKRVEAKQGTVVICPSSFTHTHRGNPPLSGDKYIFNGWVEYS